MHPDLVYLKMFRDASLRPMVMQHYIERRYGIQNLIRNTVSSLEFPIPEYSSWVLMHLAIHHPEHLKDLLDEITDAFLQTDNQTILRNLSRVLICYPIAKNKEDELLNYLIKQLENKDNKVALHVNCVYKLIQFVQKYPELKNEIQASIELLLIENKPASLVASYRNFLKQTKSLHC